MSHISHLVTDWRKEAELLRRRYANDMASLVDDMASELEAALLAHDLEALTLDEAAKESGYSYSALQKKVMSGELDNVGKKGSPRVLRGQLPRKGGKPDIDFRLN